MEQVHAREDLLPGTAGPALRVRLGGGDSVGPQLRGRHDPAPAVGQVVQGAGESGVLWFMTGRFPCLVRRVTVVTRSSTNQDKLVLKDACSDAENQPKTPWSLRCGPGVTARITRIR
ncbi:hypothetical protein GCM10020295_54280 [Streptomyces cinereospinus]